MPVCFCNDDLMMIFEFVLRGYPHRQLERFDPLKTKHHVHVFMYSAVARRSLPAQ